MSRPQLSSPWVFGAFLVLLFLGWLTAGLSWELNHGVVLVGAGALMMFFRPRADLPTGWLVLAWGFALLALTSFLPAEWFGIPAWRGDLQMLDLNLGTRKVIQARMALEEWAVFAMTLLIGLWLARQRLESPRGVALAFVLSVACYALISKWNHDPREVFGFFPNRNHTATLLSLGAVVGLGCTVQALREKQWVTMVVAILALGTCLIAALGWSLSRAGLLLVAIGSLGWFACLGKGYLGKHAVKLVALTALAGLGGFLVTDNPIKERLKDNVEMIHEALEPAESSDEELARPIDFRVPTWLDTVEMISEEPWAGVGPGQFRYVFPQYRKRTAVMGETRSIHPESDWLWMASEIGVPGTLLLALLVMWALAYSLKRAVKGRVRALRVACLMGAVMLVFHGLFDVPGHRLSLALAAAWLFGLSLGPSREDAGSSKERSSWFSRLLGLLPLGLGLWMILADRGSAPSPARTSAKRAQIDALRLYREDQALLEASIARGEKKFEPEVDLLAEAIGVLAKASELSPLDPEVWQLRGTLALQFDDRQEEVDRSFQIERALLPGVIAVPLKQADAWGAFDAERVGDLWGEALRRAEWLDQSLTQEGYWSERTAVSIRQSAKRSRGRLMPIAESLLGSGGNGSN